MPHLFFAANGDDSEAKAATAGEHDPSEGQKMWGKTWHKLEGWLKKDGEESEPPAMLEEPEHMEERAGEQAGSQTKPPRAVIPALQRPATFARQNSERRDKLYPIEPDADERRATSANRAVTAYIRKPLSPYVPYPSSSSPTPHTPDRVHAALGEDVKSSPPSQSRQETQEEQEDIQLDPFSAMPRHDMLLDQEHLSEALDDLQIQAELEAKWILNLSMHFRDNSDREKFFITYAEEPNKWRRVTISCDYRNVYADSLEADLKSLHYQRDKSARIYESIRDSLPSIQFYPTVTNLKLQTDDGRLHVHVTEDVNERIQYPSANLLRHLDCPRFKESTIEFDSHLSGFVYKIRVGSRVYIKKEIPGPEAVEEFLYEVNALSNLRDAENVVQFEGIVVDDSEKLIKGLLIGFCEQGALVDVLYDYKNSEWLPWSRREQWAKQIVKGLSDIHEAGFVQGDFTLSNIVIDRDDTARIIDINRRGCPVGWEPPELAKLIQSGQRISIYIGVKSDIYQLGMVLWALAEQQDEPERQEGSLVLSNSSEIPAYYRQIVESCLSEDPGKRLSAKDLFAKFPSLEGTQPQSQSEREATLTRPCLSPHRTEKEYIDPATAVGLEDIDHLKLSSQGAGTHLSQFSASEDTFADGATSTEYLFVSSGSDMAGRRWRSPSSFDARRAKRRSKVSNDVDSDFAGSSRESPMTPAKYDPGTLDMPHQASEATLDKVEPPTSSITTTTPTLAADGQSVPDTQASPVTQPVPAAQLAPAAVTHQDDKNTSAVEEVPNDLSAPQPSQVDGSQYSDFILPHGPPVHQDSGFHDFPVPELASERLLRDDAPSALLPSLAGLGISVSCEAANHTSTPR